MSIFLPGMPMVKKKPSQRINADLQQAFNLRRRDQRIPRSPKVEGDHGSYGRQPDDHGECLKGGFVSENNLRHLTLEPMRDYQADVNDDETAKDDQPDEVELRAACRPPRILGNQGNRAPSADDIMI